MSVNFSPVRSSRLRSRRRRNPYSGSSLRTRRPRSFAVTRRRTELRTLLASCTTWKWPTTSVAWGKCFRTAAR
jgi:hypothetical protein